MGADTSMADASSLFDDDAWRRRLAAARSEHRAGGGTVLDALMRHWPHEAELLLAELESRSGIAALEDAAGWSPGFDRWSIEQARAHQCVVLRGTGDELVGAAADPWMPTLHRVVERAV